jgi:hypothetical protein
MPAVPAIVFLVAAMACSLLGRILLVNAAHSVSTRWLFIVLFVPFGPLAFRLQYPELARPTRYWRLATGPLMLLFFLNGGNAESFRSLKDLGKPNSVQAAAGNTDFHLPVPKKVVASIPKSDEADLGGAEHAAKTTAAAKPATPSPAVAAAASKMAAAPQILSVADRVEANRLEFVRLAQWYDDLKHQRGYLRKGDLEAIDAYNTEAAKYQAALQIAKTEQAAISKLTAKK